MLLVTKSSTSKSSVSMNKAENGVLGKSEGSELRQPLAVLHRQLSHSVTHFEGHDTE